MTAEPQQRPVLKFLGRTEVAHYLGMRSINSLSGVTLPPHDAEIGDRKGWFPTTIDVWAAKRPGRGRWGARMGQTRGQETVTADR
jgi:hypothetical protein